MKLSILIPVFNEEKTIVQVLEKIRRLKLSWEKEIIIINDGSTDRTLSLIKKYSGFKLISYRKNKGKGFAVKKGIRIATGDYFLIQDADLEYDPQDIPRLLKAATGGVAVFGNRFSKNKINMPFLYRLGNKILTFITNLLYKTKLSDMETGYKLLPAIFIKDIKIESSRFDFEPEITVKLIKSKIPIVQVPISYQGRSRLAGKKLTVRDAYGALKTLMNYRFSSLDKIVLLVFLILVVLIYSVIAVQTHNHFQTFGWDLGYFDQVIWKVSKGIFPYSTLSKVNLLAGHFAPVLYLFASLYWLWSDPRILLIVQAFLVVFAAYPLYLLAKEESLNIVFSYSLVFSYLFFLGTQWSILNEFHEASVIPLFLILFFYSANHSGRKLLFYLSILGIFSSKEEFSLLAASLSFPLYFYYHRKKLAVILFIFSVLFFFFLTGYFMPSISEKGTYQHAHLSLEAKTPSEFIWKLATDPQFIIRSVSYPPEKVFTLFTSLASFGFLPIFAPVSILIPSIEQFLMRFLYSGPQFTVYLNVNHHAAPISMLLPIAVIFAVSSALKKFPRHKKKILTCASTILLISSVSQDIIFKAPIHSILKPTLYNNEAWVSDAHNLVKSVPKNVPLAAQNSLFPHLSQRKEIYLLPEIKNAQVIAVDFHDGANKFAPLDLIKTKRLINNLIENGSFRITKKIGDSFVLERITK